MNRQHPQEKILRTFDYKGIPVDYVEWNETIWCGKLGYAVNNTDEPDVEQISIQAAQAMRTPANEREANWEVCISLNYRSSSAPNGVMFGFLVATPEQADCYDLLRVPVSHYMRIPICDETALALGQTPWTGGIPPYEWIGEQIAPELGFTYGSPLLPIIEYYGFFDSKKDIPQCCYLYVPVQEN